MRDVFEKTLNENPYDKTSRLIYADWLSENGFDDEAEFHRAWTVDWQHAKEWFDDFAEEHDVPLNEVLSTAQGFYNAEKDGRNYRLWDLLYTQDGNDSLRDFMYEDENRIEFWKNYCTFARLEMVDGLTEVQPFSCSC